MRAYDILECKRRGKELTREQLQFFIDGYISGEIPDYQASAWLMAVCCNGMTDREAAILTEIMANSGDMVDLSAFGDKTVDKHSTGGVGDKTSLIIAPIVASLGGKVAKMSGRGLGYTGGTIDKLEAIPNYKTMMEPNEFMSAVSEVGMAIIGQSGDIAPADKKLYALRDVTATVESIPLITSSIMSKKLAAGAHSIVLDVKVGSGAFMKTYEDAKHLATAMVNIGNRLGRQVRALITNMDVPLGAAIGNALEVIEAVAVLKGEVKGELYDICVALASEMTALSMGLSDTEAKAAVEEAISSGKAFDKMCEWVERQGGDSNYLKDTSLFTPAKYSLQFQAPQSGYISALNAAALGAASVGLGAGRIRKGDEIDLAAGILLERKTGEKVEKGDVICTLYSNCEDTLSEARQRCLEAVEIGKTPPTKQQLIYEIIK